MPTLMVLTDADKRLLQRMLDQQRHTPINPLGRQHFDSLLNSQHVYVAKAHVGIPPRAGLTTGSATCQVYQILSDGSLDDIGTEETVHNLSADAVDAGSWLLVVRDKFGSWVAVAGADAGEDAQTGTSGTAVGFTGCRAVLDQCSGVVEYWRFVDGVLVTVDSVPCDECFSGTGTGTSAPQFWWCISPPGDTGTGTFGGNTGTGTGIDNATCVQLTQSAKDILVAQDWMVHGSAHASLALCLADCVYPPPTGTGDGPPGTVSTTCSPDVLLPAAPHVTVTDKTGSCVCVTDFQMLYNSSSQQWISTTNICSSGLPINLSCAGSVWTFMNATVGSGTLVSSSYDPFQLVFDVVGQGACTGTWRATITR